MSVIKIPCALYARKITKDGNVTNYGLVSTKAVTTAGVNYLVSSLIDSTTNPADVFSWHDSGTGTTAEAIGDTALVTPTGVARVDGTQVTGASNNIYRTVATITYDASYAITEHGVFSASTAGTLLDRSVFTAINVANTDTIEFTYELTLPAGG